MQQIMIYWYSVASQHVSGSFMPIMGTPKNGVAFGVWSVVCVRSAGSIYVKHESSGKLV